MKREQFTPQEQEFNKRVIKAFYAFGMTLPIYDTSNEQSLKDFFKSYREIAFLIPTFLADLSKRSIEHPRQFAQFKNLIRELIGYVEGVNELPDMEKYQLGDRNTQGMSRDEFLAHVEKGAKDAIAQWQFKYKDQVKEFD